ncbi:Signal peptidase IB [bacterium HR33]|nr:Signal peptidase IB [bacterium HR33]
MLAWATRLGTRWPQIYYMTGPSMEPSVRAGELFLAWIPAGELARGDLVIFEFTDADSTFHVLRRVAGLPGDTVSMRAGAVVVNGRVQPWPYRVVNPAARRSELALAKDLYDWGPWVVPPDSLLLLSDRRDMLGWPDSRFLGFVPKDLIVGKVTRTLRRRLR